MDLSSIGASISTGGVSEQIDIGVLNAVSNLEQVQSALLFASIGIGSGVDASA